MNQQERYQEIDARSAAATQIIEAEVTPIDAAPGGLGDAPLVSVTIIPPLEQAEPEYEPISAPPPQRFLLYPLVIVAVASLLLSMGASLFIAPFFTRATITIFPDTKAISTHTVFTEGQLPTRPLRQVQETLTTTVQTSGVITRPASPAHGLITLYNASPASQIVDAGTLIIARNGTQVVTDQSITIAGAAPPIEGSGSVTAHTLTTGSASNIAANAISGPCCKAYLFAYNTQFFGGAEASTYHTPTSTDIAGAAGAVKHKLDLLTMTQIASQIKNGETLLPAHCTSTLNSSAQEGAAADQITVTEQETCEGLAYNTNELHMLSTAFLTSQATQLFGTAYQPIGSMQTDITNTTVTNKQVHIAVTITGTVRYQLTRSDEEQLKHTLAGKSREQAYALLLAMKGVTRVQIASLDTLPDTSRIDLQVAPSPRAVAA